MLEPISIVRTRNDLKRQIDFIKRLDRSYDLIKHRKWIIIFALVSTLEISLLQLTPSNSLVTLKAVSFILVSLMWICSLVYLLWYFTKVWRINRWTNNAIVEALKRDKDYLAFDSDKLYYTGSDFKSEINWNYFKGYLEDPVSIYLFPEGSILLCQSFSSSEIGHENLLLMKQIVKARLPKVETKISL